MTPSARLVNILPYRVDALLGEGAVLALFGTALTTSVWYWLVQRDNAGRLSLFLFLVPVLGVGLAVLTLGEQIGWREGIGIILTLSGVLLALRADKYEDPKHRWEACV